MQVARVAPPRQIATQTGACAPKRQEPLPLVNIVIVSAHGHAGTAQMVVEQVVERAIGVHSDGLPRQHVGSAGVGNGTSVAGLLVGGEWVVGYRPIGVKGGGASAAPILAEGDS